MNQDHEKKWEKDFAALYVRLPVMLSMDELHQIKDFIREQLSLAREESAREERLAWLAGERCESCGKEKTKDELWSMCDDCV